MRAGRTEQQIAAEAALEQAIRAAAIAYGFGDTVEFVGDWVVIAECPHLDDHDSTYAVLWSGGGMPRHRMLGLLAAGDESLDDEEEP